MSHRSKPAAVTVTILLGLLYVVPGSRADLIAHYSFDQVREGVALDDSGKGHHGKVSGAQLVPSPRGHALSFDGVDDSVDYGSDPSLCVEGDLSLLMWVKTDASIAPSTHRLLFGDTAGTIDRNLNLRLDRANQLRFEWGNGQGGHDALLTDSSVLDGSWRHLAVVCESATGLITLYVDAEAHDQKQMAVPISRTEFGHRLSGAWGWGNLKGQIDDIRLHDTALAESEIQRLFTLQGGTVGDDAERLQAGLISTSEPVALPAQARPNAAPFECREGRLSLDPSKGDLGGVVTARLINRSPSEVTTRVSAYAEGRKLIARETITVPARAQVEALIGGLQLTPAFADRTDFLLASAGEGIRQICISSPGSDTIRSRIIGAPADMLCEPVHVEVKDPWQRRPGPVRPAGVLCVIRTAIRLDRLREGSLALRLVSRTTKQEVFSRTVENPGPVTSVDLPTGDLDWGAYDLSCTWRDAGVAEGVTGTALVTLLPGEPFHIRVLNNLVTELMDARRRRLLDRSELPFMNPRDGWCYFELRGNASVALDGAPQPIVAANDDQPAEAMRRLGAGRHALHITGTPEQVVVRTIPTLIYNVHQATPRIAAFGPHTWDRVWDAILPECNLIEGGGEPGPEAEQWRAMGREWVTWVQTPGLSDWARTVTVQQADECWRAQPGYSHPLTTGIQADEIITGYSADSFRAFTRSMGNLASDPGFAGRTFIPFVTAIHHSPHGRAFVRTVMAAGWPFSIERYIPEAPSESEGRKLIRQGLVGRCESWERELPGSMRKAIVSPMYAVLPYCTSNTCPQADFRVHLDLQMQLLATDPLFFGLYGVQPYRSNYADPETLRWMGCLLRHYCIEGNTERFSSDPYELTHILNPDFEDGLQHWQATSATTDSVRSAKFSGFGALQGRYPPSSRGDTVAVLTRDGSKPNVVSQTIRGLQAGRAYSYTCISADFEDLLASRSRRAKTTVCVDIEGAQVLPGAFQDMYPNVRGPGVFGKDNRFWMSYHWGTFRATGPTARLLITDWQAEDDPCGPVGGQTAINNIEIQPYFEG